VACYWSVANSPHTNLADQCSHSVTAQQPFCSIVPFDAMACCCPVALSDWCSQPAIAQTQLSIPYNSRADESRMLFSHVRSKLPRMRSTFCFNPCFCYFFRPSQGHFKHPVNLCVGAEGRSVSSGPWQEEIFTRLRIISLLRLCVNASNRLKDIAVVYKHSLNVGLLQKSW